MKRNRKASNQTAQPSVALHIAARTQDDATFRETLSKALTRARGELERATNMEIPTTAQKTREAQARTKIRYCESVAKERGMTV